MAFTFLRAYPLKSALGIVSGSAFSVQFNRAYCNSIKAQQGNPLLNKTGPPLFSQIKSSDVLPAVETDLAQLKRDFKASEDIFKTDEVKKCKGPKCYADVVEKMEVIQAPLSYSWSVVNHLMGVKNSDELRKAHESAQTAVVEINQAIGQSQPLYEAYQNLKENNWDRMDECQKRIVKAALLQMESSGIGLKDADREKFNRLQLELAELTTKFSNNVLDSTKSFSMKLTDAKDVAGLPLSAKALLAQQAKQAGDEGATAENGPWLVTLDLPSYLPCMQHMQNGKIREQLYRAYVTRASEGEHNNTPIIQRVLQIKYEMSHLLGYKSFAEQSLATKMAPNVDKVIELIEMLREKSYPAAKRDLEQVRAFAKSKGHTEELQLWDVPYWSERLRESLYNYTEEELRPYFPLPSVLDGMFGLASRLFDITITAAAPGEVEVWHPDVKFFNIVDNKTKKHVASFYLDPYSRPAEKRGGAWMDVCLGKSKALNRQPIAYLICNGSPPVGNKPSLMTFREVETLFHEFGHGLQHMLTTVEHGDAAGISNVEWDAVELPSQFMENWCYDRPTLYGFAKHYETGAPLPEELYQKLKDSKNFQAGMQMLRQLYFGITDMRIHAAYNPFMDEDNKVSPFDIQRETAKQYTVLSPLPNDRFLCSFSHIFAGGYSAGYYSYKWAEVMSADAFAAFEEVGLQNEQAVRQTGKRFRDTVLAMGGGRHPGDVFRDFRGRDPSPEALLRHSGLTN